MVKMICKFSHQVFLGAIFGIHTSNKYPMPPLPFRMNIASIIGSYTEELHKWRRKKIQ